MAWTRKQTADTIKNLRYAIRSGACIVARNHLKAIGAGGARVSDATWDRLITSVNACQTARHFRKRRRR